MSKYSVYILSIILLVNYSCNDAKETGNTEKLHSSGDVYVDHDGTVVNQLDEHNLKQGKWMIYREGDEKSTTNIRSLEDEGCYKDDKKVGYWKHYSKYGETVDSVLYEDGVQKVNGTKTYTYAAN